MILDLKEPIPETRDQHKLGMILHALIGQPCRKVRFSYAGELRLHFGQAVAHEHPKMAGEIKGTWILGTRASWWRLFLAGRGLVMESPGEDEPADERATVEKLLVDLVGKTVVAAGITLASPDLAQAIGTPTVVGGFGLIVLFNDGSNAVVVPQSDDEAGDGPEEEPLADWELLTPYHHLLRAGPGPVWEYRTDGSRDSVTTTTHGVPLAEKRPPGTVP